MSKLLLGLVCGLVFGVVDILLMIPLQFADKKAAMAGAFVNRFAIGLVIGATNLALPGWIAGLGWGVLLSLPDAIITKSWAPITIGGAIGGIVIGLITGHWGK
jgi:hypothetical protein